MTINYIPKYIPLFKSYNPPQKEYLKGEPIPLDPDRYKDGNINFLLRFLRHQFLRIAASYRLALQAVRLRLDGVRSHFCAPDGGASQTENRDPTTQDEDAAIGATTTAPYVTCDMCQEGEENKNGED